MLRRIVMVLAIVFALVTAGGAAHAQSSSSYGTPGVVGDNQTVTQGSDITITFTNLPPNTDFDVVVNSNPINLGTHRSDGNGTLSVTFSTAGLDVGAHTVTATGGGVTAVAHFTVVAATGGAVTGAAIPRTGSSSTIPMTSVALTLLALGGLVVFASRRRHAHHAESRNPSAL